MKGELFSFQLLTQMRSVKSKEVLETMYTCFGFTEFGRETKNKPGLWLIPVLTLIKF